MAGVEHATTTTLNSKHFPESVQNVSEKNPPREVSGADLLATIVSSSTFLHPFLSRKLPSRNAGSFDFDFWC